MMDPRATSYYVGRFLQVVGMGLTLYGLFLSIVVGVQEKESLHSMTIEFQYLGAGALFSWWGSCSCDAPAPETPPRARAKLGLPWARGRISRSSNVRSRMTGRRST